MRSRLTTLLATFHLDKFRPRYYWATLRYLWDGEERTVNVKLPNSGFTFGLVKGHETDLIVLRSLPHKPLIRAVYLGRG